MGEGWGGVTRDVSEARSPMRHPARIRRTGKDRGGTATYGLPVYIHLSARCVCIAGPIGIPSAGNEDEAAWNTNGMAIKGWWDGVLGVWDKKGAVLDNLVSIGQKRSYSSSGREK